jgi:purine-nucleoside phosphorylase
MLIADHINLMGTNPLVGPNDESLGPRFPDMSEPYDRGLQAVARAAAAGANILLREGVYVGLLGPSLETRAEYRFLQMIGADAVGMSTIPEVLAAVHAGLRVIGVSLISDLCFPDTLEPVDLRKLLRVARAAEPAMTRLLGGMLRRLGGAAASPAHSVPRRRAAKPAAA